MLNEPSPSAAHLLDEAISLLGMSQSRGGWVGPARTAFDGITEEFRARLIAVSLRLRSSG